MKPLILLVYYYSIKVIDLLNIHGNSSSSKIIFYYLKLELPCVDND